VSLQVSHLDFVFDEARGSEVALNAEFPLRVSVETMNLSARSAQLRQQTDLLFGVGYCSAIGNGVGVILWQMVKR